MTLAVRQIVEDLRRDARVGPQLVDALYLPPAEARYGDLDPPLAPPLAAALRRSGVERLWSHQAAGLAAVRAGRDVLVTTPTASGKSLVFHLPVLEAAARGEPGRALFLFPLKALGQDQRGKLEALAAAAGIQGQAPNSPNSVPVPEFPEFPLCAVYDGDTSRTRRQQIKNDFPRVVVSNPDMVHLGLLGYWRSWSPFFRDLRWIVLDELHTYRGIFGSHFHHVLERLLRLCREQGARPTLVASSATAANAGEFAARLTGREFEWIAESGAPREGRHFLLFRPDASPYTFALQLLVRLLEADMKTIVFTKARRITELLYSWLRQQEPRLASRVASYRSGFLASERRKIERDLFSGRLAGVISTSALEMGIDVGGLDACVLVGYPGSVMATWQRSGRVGRAGRESITALVALPDALDQYLLDHPSELVGRPCERLVVDPLNEPVGRAHLVCAAAELPLQKTGDRGYLEPRAALVGELLRDRELLQSEDETELLSPRRRPQRKVSLRGTGQTATILNSRSGRVVGTVDGVRVLHECHPGAVYLHRGRQYLVHELDLEGEKVHAEPVRLDYFTTPLTEKDTEILEVLERRRDGPLAAWLGRLLVTERVVGYERKKIFGGEPIDRHRLELPPVRFDTVGLWWAAPAPIEEALKLKGEDFMGALHASEHAAISLFPLHAICDRGDIGGISLALHPQVGSGCVFVYDGHPGGVGIAERGFRDLPELLTRVLELLDSCECERGCPSCVQSPKCGNGNRPLDKGGAARTLRILLGREAAPSAIGEPPEVRPRAEPPADDSAAGVGEAEVGEPSAAPSAGSAVGPAAPEPAPAPPAVESAAPTVSRRARAPRGPAAVAAPPRRTMLFDLETVRSAAEVGGWANAHRMRVAVGVVCHLEEGRFETFREDGVAALVERLETADRVVGFNVKRFDYRVLAGYTGLDYARRLPTLDLLEDVAATLGFRLGLNHLARETLGVEKTADGLQSLEWVREGRLERVEEYCRRDVEILRDLYLFGRRMGYVLFRDKEQRRIRLPVDW